MRRRLLTSGHNSDFRRLLALRDRRSERYSERRFLVEGPRFVHDAARYQRPERLVVSESSELILDLPDSDECIVLGDVLFRRLSGTDTPQGLIGVFTFPEVAIGGDHALLDLWADGVQDPGNLGTMIRSAAALGATSVVCGTGTVDPFAPKVVRSAAGAHFQVAIRSDNLDDLMIEGMQIVVLDGGSSVPIHAVDLALPTALVVGSEAHGVTAAVRNWPNLVSAAIPMTGGVESLNAGVAASIVLYEASRQRRMVAE